MTNDGDAISSGSPLAPPVFDRSTAFPAPSRERVEIDLDALDVFCYVMSHRPVVRGLAIRNVNVDPAAGELTISINIEAPTLEPLLHETVVAVPIPEPGDIESFSTLRLAPNPRALALLDESVSANLVVTVAVAGRTVGTHHHALNVLAYNQWFNRRDAFDSFASFVLPQHPEVLQFVDRARTLLGQRTGLPATDGYQGVDRGDVIRVDQIAEAAFHAVAERELGYTNPPASFEGFGQKIRTPDRVTSEGSATCLDLAVLYSGCLAAAGLDPVLIVTEDHTFAGYLTGVVEGAADHLWFDDLLARSVLDNANEISALLTAGAIHVVETTALTTGPERLSFSAARTLAEEHVRGRLGSVRGLVNVRRAREAGVQVLPARQTVDGVTQLIMADPLTSPRQPAHEAVSVSPPAPADGAPVRGRLGRFECPPRVERWLNALLDLSFVNPLLNLRDGRGAFRFDLKAEQLALVEDRLMSHGQVLELVPGSKAPNRLLDADDIQAAVAADFGSTGRLYWPSPAAVGPTIDSVRKSILDQNPGSAPSAAATSAERTVDAEMTAQLERRIAAVRRKARELETQLGSNNLFVTIGSLSWLEPETASRRGAKRRRVTSPLFLVPVRVTGSAATAFKIVADENPDIVPNYCLLEKLRLSFDCHIPELEQPDLDDAGIDVPRVLASIRRRLADARITDAVVEETAHLAVLNFSSFRLWKDLRDHWQAFMANDVVRHLVETPYETYDDTAVLVPDVDVLLPMDSDESQVGAVRAAVAGRSFVIEGPPGTGKSQTIANLLASAIAAGRRVLFVAEKQPALTVVKKRLEQIGLNAFLMDLHDKGSKPDQIREQLRQSLDFAGEDREREWADTFARLSADGAVLSSYRHNVHDTNAAGHSVWSARQEQVELGDGPTAPVDVSFLGLAPTALPAIREALLRLPGLTGDSGITAESTWTLSNRSTFADLDTVRLSSLVEQLAATLAVIDALPNHLCDGINRPSDLDDLAAIMSSAIGLAGVPQPRLRELSSEEWRASRDRILSEVHSVLSEQIPVRAVFSDDVYTSAIDELIQAGVAAVGAGIFSRKKQHRRFVAAVQPFLRVAASERPFAELLSLLQKAKSGADSLARLRSDLRTFAGPQLLHAPDLLRPASLTEAEGLLAALPDQARRLLSPTGHLVTAALGTGWRPHHDTIVALSNGAATWASLASLLESDDMSFIRWIGTRPFLGAWRASAQAWAKERPRFLALQRWCEVRECLLPVANAGLTRPLQALLDGTVPVGDAYDWFRRGLVGASLVERRGTGRLDQFDGLAHTRRVESFRSQDHLHRKLMATVIPHRLVASRPFRPGQRIGEYGALERELSKRSRKLGIRKLIERYGPIVPNLTPCFLMSPDSVARFIPPGSIAFDLVVFDEASQIEVARAVGAMGRATSVVVVGDSKQMPPSKFGGTSVGDESDEMPDEPEFLDLESILSECVESNLPRHWLECHYRSRHEGLIAFSNSAFYDGRLTTFPSSEDGSFTPIKWRRVEGEFLRSGDSESLRTNPTEAAEIVKEILSRTRDANTRHQSICVVTLNIQQSNLIVRLLEESGDPTILELLEDDSDSGLIVRNLESVQGDERDVVILSVAFAAPLNVDSAGNRARGRLPLNFGPLNRRGGERRLNVAVTRAREEVLVFCSFEPEDMQLSSEPARGMELLKRYLTMARDSGQGSSADLSARAPTPIDHHRSEIACALRSRGLRVRENVGVSRFRVDLAVGASDRNDWPVAVLLDGPSWASRGTVYDRDVLPVRVLPHMGWQRVERIWLPSWLDERDRTIDAIEKAVSLAPRNGESADESNASPAAPSFAAPIATESVNISPPLSNSIGSPVERTPPGALESPPAQGLESVFVPASTSLLGSRDTLDRLGEPAAREQVVTAIRQAISEESPIQLGRLAKIVATRFGLGSVRQGRVAELKSLIPRELMDTSDFGTFVWSHDRPRGVWPGYRRTPPGSDRGVDDIAPDEIANALVDLVRMGHVVEIDELFRHVGEVFGLQRLRAPTRLRFDGILVRLVELGRLSRTADSVRLPPEDGPPPVDTTTGPVR